MPRAPEAGIVLQLVGACKRYGPRLAVAPTDLDIREGRTTVLIGPSGCGKTTLLRMMIGLARPDEGQVRFRGIALTEVNARALRARMGYVIQEASLFPHLTATANVTLMARHLRWEPTRIAGRLAELVELTRFPTDALVRFPAELSGGQRQRVSLMRALMLDPELLLLDEPLGAIDPLVRAELGEDLARIFKTLRKSVVLVTHDLAEAAFFADEIVLLRDGRIVQIGSPADLVRSPADPFVTRFVQAHRQFGLEGGTR